MSLGDVVDLLDYIYSNTSFRLKFHSYNGEGRWNGMI